MFTLALAQGGSTQGGSAHGGALALTSRALADALPVQRAGDPLGLGRARPAAPADPDAYSRAREDAEGARSLLGAEERLALDADMASEGALSITAVRRIIAENCPRDQLETSGLDADMLLLLDARIDYKLFIAGDTVYSREELYASFPFHEFGIQPEAVFAAQLVGVFAPAGAHTGAHAGAPAGAHSGAHTGAPAGAHTGAHTGAHSGAHAGAHLGAPAGAHSGAHSGARAGAHTGAPAGAHTGAPAGAHTGAHSGARAGAHTGAPAGAHFEYAVRDENDARLEFSPAEDIVRQARTGAPPRTAMRVVRTKIYVGREPWADFLLQMRFYRGAIRHASVATAVQSQLLLPAAASARVVDDISSSAGGSSATSSSAAGSSSAGSSAGGSSATSSSATSTVTDVAFDALRAEVASLRAEIASLRAVIAELQESVSTLQTAIVCGRA